MPLPPVLGLGRRLAWTRERLESHQLAALRRVIAHARERVPYYRRTLANVEPASIRSADDLLALPTVSKRQLRTAPLEDRLADGTRAGRLLRMRSSGSTGEPFDIYRSVAEELTMVLFAHRIWRALGHRWGDRWARLAGGGAATPGWRPRLLGMLRRRVHVLFSCRQPPAEIAAGLRRFAPTFVNGYPGALALVAPLLGADASGGVRPRLVVTAGEVLTPDMRRAIEAGFRAPVREVYGSYELGLVGWTCSETGLFHIADDAVVLEVVDAGRAVSPGEEGEVIATVLHARAHPFVRYRLGDRAVRGPCPCPCGLPFSTLQGIRGRVVDVYRLPDGRTLHHFDLVMPAAIEAGVREWIGRYQMVQERLDLFVLRVELLDRSRGADFERIRPGLERRLGAGVELRIELVGEIDFEPSGKFRVAHSRVAAEP